MSGVEARFKAAVVARLERLEPMLIPVLQQLVGHAYPDEVRSVDFEVFCDGFTQEFPVRAFFMDSESCEHFVTRGDTHASPSPVDPGLLDIEFVYTEDFEDEFRAEDESIDVLTLAGEALIPWFASCWHRAGGDEFEIGATIKLHDELRSYDLVLGRWRDL